MKHSLKECPFCQVNSHLRLMVDDKPKGGKNGYVQCSICFCRGPLVDYFIDKSSAEDVERLAAIAWNRGR